MKKIIQIVAMILPTTLYILFFQILFPPKYKQFDEVYSADTVIIQNIEDKRFDILKPYEEDGFHYVEIVSVREITITLQSETTQEILVNGTTLSSSQPLNVVVKGNGILIESATPVVINGAYTVMEINEDTVTDKISVSIGTIIGVLILGLMVRSKLPFNFKVTITLAVLTVSIYMLQTILQDMFYVLVSADVGWMLGMGVERFKTKREKIAKQNAQTLANYLGNV